MGRTNSAMFAFPLPLAYQVGKGNNAVLAECGDKPLQGHKLGIGAGTRRIKPSQEVDHA
ncbi:hypothetical protein RSO01_93240 [Reyranella soli]|uniref:Uncharacterized protein n=1 Tax=Reyranella soli TaxID=1230389 RepID=A0A512NT71_9HYPH|nr:hypothetical protein RSO01_93240 [Reyranella soli]